MSWRDLIWRRKPKLEVLGKSDTAASGDDMVIDQLRRLGADLSQAREVRHYLYLPTPDACQRAAGELSLEGFRTDQKPAANAAQDPPNPWLILATTRMVVNLKSVADSRRRLEELATALGGEYDGWEAAPKP